MSASSELDLSAADGSCSTAPTARPTAPRRRSSAGSGRRSRFSPIEPDGRNINDGCGSTHLDLIADTRPLTADSTSASRSTVTATGCSPSTATASVVDGDELIALAALHMRERGLLDGGGVAVTVMTNYGFHNAMREAGIEVAITAVGDRYVLDELRRRGWSLGGEQSGHIIDLGFGPSGDGIASALLTLEALAGDDLAERHAMHKLPQRLVNIRASDREALRTPRSATRTSARRRSSASAGLEGRGRVLVRASGTEPLFRVMVEAPSQDETDTVCTSLAAVIERALGD